MLGNVAPPNLEIVGFAFAWGEREDWTVREECYSY